VAGKLASGLKGYFSAGGPLTTHDEIDHRPQVTGGIPSRELVQAGPPSSSSGSNNSNEKRNSGNVQPQPRHTRARSATIRGIAILAPEDQVRDLGMQLTRAA
jgi:hypothetical protein